MKKSEISDLNHSLGEELQKTAHSVSDLMAPMGLMQNYLSCISFEIKKAKNSNDRALIIWSLGKGERGIDNLIETLEILSERVDGIACQIMDYAEELDNNE